MRLAFARTLIAKGDFGKAEAELKALLEKYPKAPPVHVQFGTLALARRDFAAARTSFMEADALMPNTFEALAGLVATDIGQQKPADARARIDRALTAAPRNPQVLMLAARLYATVRDMPAAEKVLRTAIEVDPNNLPAYGMLGQVFLAQRKLDQAITEFDTLAKMQPKSIAAPTLVAMILQGQGKNDEARKRYEGILQIDNRAAVAANNLAWMYAESGENLDLALQYAQVAKEQLPNNSEVNDTLGWVYFKKGLFTQAVPLFESAVDQAPNNPEYHYRLGQTYIKAGDWEKGRKSLNAALKLKADFPGADEARKLLQQTGS